MSISSEITRLSGNVSDALTAIAAKGVTIPSGSNSDDLATLIGQIQTGGGSSGLVYETGTYTPASDTVQPTITFSNSHSTKPFLALISDATGTTLSTNYSEAYFCNISWYTVFGSTIITPSNNYYARSAFIKSIYDMNFGWNFMFKKVICNH